ncbi:MAG: NAD-dependent epimerase/dehydratase family protein [Hyphomicrobiales bacterium]|uniref:NAD-dependent epimerase/dehydratase family protein n=1 Tax=Roseibium polysiphoniae TaxID=2571221 RepID=UPI00329714E9
MKQSVLITGAAGFFGQHLTQYLSSHAHVIAGVRQPIDGIGETQVLGDLVSLPDLNATLERVDVVVHCAARAHVLREEVDDPLPLFMAVNRDATLHLAQQAAAAKVKRFIFLSSIGVNGNQTESTPFRADDVPAPHSPYAMSKLAAETELAKISAVTGMEIVILRPALIIGPRPVGNLAVLARMISKGVPLPFALASENRRSLVKAATLADLIRVCLTHPNAPGTPLLVADKTPMSTRGILEMLAVDTGQTLRLVPVPIPLLRFALRTIGYKKMDQQLFGNLEVDITATSARLNWAPPPAEYTR